MSNTRGGVLFHARGSMTADEVRFYQGLGHSLEQRGLGLTIVGHHLPLTGKLPIFRVPSGLHKVQLGACTDSFCDATVDDLDDLLQTDQMWRGPVRSKSDREQRIRALRYFEGYYNLLLEYVRPRIVLIWNGVHPQEKLLATMALKRGCRLGFIERGPIPGTIQYDHQGVLGGSSFADQSDWTWESPAVAERWLSAYEVVKKKLQKSPRTWWSQPKSRGRDSVMSQLKLDRNKQVLLFAGQVDRDAQTLFFSPSFGNTIDALSWVCHRLEGREDWQLLGKHHPQSDLVKTAFQDIVKGRGVWTGGTSLEDALGVSQRVIAINSTVLYEAMLRDVPAMALGRGLFSGKKVFYELDGQDDTSVFNAFLEGDGYDERADRFRDMMAFLMAHHLYDFNGNWSDEGLNGARQFAERLAGEIGDMAHPVEIDVPVLEVLRFLSMTAVEPSWTTCVDIMKKKLVRSCRGFVKRLI